MKELQKELSENMEKGNSIWVWRIVQKLFIEDMQKQQEDKHKLLKKRVKVNKVGVVDGSDIFNL